MIIIAQFYYKYGTMDSSKTANLLMAVHSYETKGDKVLILKPKTDTRSKSNIIESRIGLSHPCMDIHNNFDILDYVTGSKDKIDAVFIDECQWLTLNQIIDLCRIVDTLNIPVLAYGLKNSYVKNELLEGAKYLLYYADKIEEIKNVCVYCGKKAIMNLRILNDNPIYNGNTTHIGDIKETKDYYIPVCRNHYLNPTIK
ncbi:thymidine kinase [Clostridium sporogenes]|uniref:thymidine kinase n=1 Tax=Clostridium sporogenes TaxID=1509 RepID=UPI00311AB9B3